MSPEPLDLDAIRHWATEHQTIPEMADVFALVDTIDSLRGRVTELEADNDRLKTAHQIQYEECLRQVARAETAEANQGWYPDSEKDRAFAWHEKVQRLEQLIRDLAPHCRYIDRREAEAFKDRIRAVLPPVETR